MSTLSSEIAQVILEMLEETDSAEIQRNLLAQSLGCVPSQISYVIASRFPPEQGYIVESRRGGGGCIRIRRVRVSKSATLLALINSIGGAIDETTLRAHIGNLFGQDFISREAAALTLAACGDDALRAAPPVLRDKIRANIFKRMLLRTQDL
ncbi:MAG: CtsR family transcriptional regulator [Oscillospiraceae bacterium]|jgi:transcriptional regulator CtsR|nr:CtsR family transcriptional regulator [Oscillospiraceae bacterium]